MNFLFRNKLSEVKESRNKVVTKTMHIDKDSTVYKDIPYKTNNVINVGIWINKLINKIEGGDINA